MNHLKNLTALDIFPLAALIVVLAVLILAR